MKVTITNHVATLDFNRPDRANSLDVAGWEALRDAFRTLSADPDVHTVLLTGTGKHFCAGMDLSVLAGLAERIDPVAGDIPGQFAGFITGIQECVSAIADCHQPVIAAIQGSCIGGGLAIAAACDVRLATRDAQFCVKEVDFGIVPDIGTLERIVHLVSLGVATEWALTARHVPAPEAQESGLVNTLFDDHAALLEHARELARIIAAKPPAVTAAIKRQLQFARENTVTESLKAVAVRSAQLMAGVPSRP